MAVPRSVLWDIYEEHLSEAAWLWGEWEASLDSAVYTVGEVASGPEERLLAHLDGLVLGGQPVAQKLLLPALASDDPGAVAAATWSLVQAEDADHQDMVIEALTSTEPAVQAVIGRAMSLCPNADISRLLPVWNDGTATARAMVLDIFAPREPDWVKERLDVAFRTGQPPLIAAALRAIRRSRDRDFVEHVRAAQHYPEPEIQREAIAAGLCLGLKETWGTCRAAAAANDDTCRLPLGLLAISPDQSDRQIVRSRTKDPVAGRHALWALGFAGDVRSLEVLVEAMADEKTARIAGESFSSITGVAIVGHMAKIGETKGPELEEVGDDEPPPVVRSEDFLREPNLEEVQKWFKREGMRLHPLMRFVNGSTRGPESLWAAFPNVATWRREVLSVELALTMVSPPRVDLRDWAQNQLKQCAPSLRQMVVDRKLLGVHSQTLR